MAEDQAQGWQETTSKKSQRKDRREEVPAENGLEEEEPDFSDPEDYVDDVTDEGITNTESIPRMSHQPYCIVSLILTGPTGTAGYCSFLFLPICYD